jgi:IclR family pca regulon transcriptional regulator
MLSLARGLSVIRAFGDGGGTLGVADVARRTGMSRAAARRCLHTLSVLGYASSADGLFSLTPAILSLGYAYLGSNALAMAAQPVLERVSGQVHESSSLAVLGLAVGSRLPAGSTSMGRAILAFSPDAHRARFLSRVKLKRYTSHTIVERSELRAELDRIREQGYALVDEELELGLRSLAVPVVRADGVAVAAVNIGVHVGRADRDTLIRELLPELREAARDIAAAAGLVR